MFSAGDKDCLIMSEVILVHLSLFLKSIGKGFFFFFLYVKVNVFLNKLFILVSG